MIFSAVAGSIGQTRRASGRLAQPTPSRAHVATSRVLACPADPLATLPAVPTRANLGDPGPPEEVWEFLPDAAKVRLSFPRNHGSCVVVGHDTNEHQTRRTQA